MSFSNYISQPSFWTKFGKISIFIDAANVFYTQKTLGWSIDFKRLTPFFKNVSPHYVNTFFYWALWYEEGEKRDQNNKMITMLRKQGYKVIVKDSKKVKSMVKGNCDVEL